MCESAENRIAIPRPPSTSFMTAPSGIAPNGYALFFPSIHSPRTMSLISNRGSISAVEGKISESRCSSCSPLGALIYRDNSHRNAPCIPDVSPAYRSQPVPASTTVVFGYIPHTPGRLNHWQQFQLRTQIPTVDRRIDHLRIQRSTVATIVHHEIAVNTDRKRQIRSASRPHQWRQRPIPFPLMDIA